MSLLVVVGAGGHGAVVAEAAAEMDCWSKIVFIDESDTQEPVVGFSVIGPLSVVDSISATDSEFVVAIGDNDSRLKLLSQLGADNRKIATVIHPSATISRTATIERGVVVCANVCINARARIGRGAIINTGATIDHDCIIGEGVHVSPGANLAGTVTVGNRAWIGIGSSVRQTLRIGDNAGVGAGAAVVSDVPEGITVVGVPSRPMRKE